MNPESLKMELSKIIWMAKTIQELAQEAMKTVDHWEVTKNQTPVEKLGLTIRTNNVLKCDNIFSVEQLIERTENDLMRLPTLGRKSLNEIKESLAARGLKLK